MAADIDATDPRLGRFDQSFLIQMIRDFFLILVAVTILEFGIKVGLVAYNFAVNGEHEAAERAAEIADNVRSIMLNEGGPVAARTLYPILERNMDDLGYAIAIEPAEITVRAIEEGFGFTPRGVPAPDWAEGAFKVATVEIEAEEFCQACHTTAAVGDVIGTVTVRNYLSRDLMLWWEGVKLTAGLAVGKIMLHSVLLFLLLRSRMEPLLRLRAVVSGLARAYGGLEQRAEVRSSDEFGVLARDLNLFLDRVGRLVGELDEVLSRVVAVNNDIVAIQTRLRGQVDSFVSGTRAVERRAMLNAKREPLLSEAWFAAIRRSVADLDGMLAAARENAPEAAEAAKLVATLATVVEHAEAQIRSNEALFEDLAALGSESEQFQAAMAEMTRLEERLQGIVETGSALVRRLRPGQNAAAE
ncbi:MAG: histidine kinase [Pseudomonadota bacterium]